MIYSGKFVLRLNPKKHKELAGLAVKKGVSLNALCASLIDAGMERYLGNAQMTRLDEFVLKIRKTWESQICGVVLFGSQVTGEAFDTSDVDLLVVLESSQKLNRDLYTQWDAQIDDNKKPVINPHFVLLPSDVSSCGSLWLEVSQKHKVLWEKNGKVSQVLEKISDMIFEGKVERKLTHGQPYWVWRKDA